MFEIVRDFRPFDLLNGFLFHFDSFVSSCSNEQVDEITKGI